VLWLKTVYDFILHDFAFESSVCVRFSLSKSCTCESAQYADTAMVG